MQNEVLCCSQLLVGRSECVQCKIDWRVVEILGLTDRSKTTGQVIVWATVLCSVTCAAYFLRASDGETFLRNGAKLKLKCSDFLLIRRFV
jgi:hypothetical protein